MTTLEEKQRELDALQTAFDEYIVSSRELEEELDAEFTKGQNDLAKAESRNTALASQLANLQPQLTALEATAAALGAQLAAEGQRRIAAEMQAEEAENKLREAEGTVAALRSSELRKLREENEELCERLAFVEVEAEDYKNELITDRERHRAEMGELTGDVAVMTGRLKARESELEKTKRDLDGAVGKQETVFDGEETVAPPPTAESGTSNDGREEYIRTLEEELELVTEQLIEAETKLSQSKSELEDALAQAEQAYNTLKTGTTNESSVTDTAELEATIKLLEAENTALQEESKKLKEELELALEELALSKEELEAYEEDRREQTAEFDLERKRHREEVAVLQTHLNKISSEERSKDIESKSWQETLVASKKETHALQEEVDQLEVALKHSEADRDTLQGEMDELKVAFDETALREREQSRGQHRALEETVSTRSREVSELQNMLTDTAEENEKHKKKTASIAQEFQDAQDEIYALEGLLEAARNELEAERKEVQQIRSSEKIVHAPKEESQEQTHMLDELLAARSREVSQLHEQVGNLSGTNSSLTKLLKDAENKLAKQQTENEKQQQDVACAPASTPRELQEAQDEMYALAGLLETARKELEGQRNEVQKVRSSLQEKITQAQEELNTAQAELVRTQSKLIDAEKDHRTEKSQSPIGDVEWKRKKKMARLSVSHLPRQKFEKDTEEDGTSPNFDHRRTRALSRRLSSRKSNIRPRSCSPTTIEKLKVDAKQQAATVSSLRVECDRLEDQNRMGVSMKRKLEDEIKQLQQQSGSDASASKKEKEDPVQYLMEMEDRDIEDVLHTNDLEMIGKEVRSMAKKMSAQKSHNAELLTRILKLQGNIQVCCRIRPMSRNESQKGLHEVAQSLSETEVGCFDERTQSWKSYAFDKVWGPETGQKAVAQDVEPMALSVLDGYNACIFAYGQTGSGKTYTMEGSQSNGQYGISQRTIQKLFTLLQDKAHRHQQNMSDQDNETPSSKFEYNIEVAMLEIYNDEVYDLLDPTFSTHDMSTHRKKSLDIRHGTEKTVEVRGLRKESVNTVSEVLSALDRGNSNRAKASTNLNEHSSRSHMILHVEVTSGVGEAKSKGNLYLVDLAGSERVGKSEVEGQALKEAQHINKSLSALGNVMEALDRKSSHVPYRDSKLTYLLQNSLGGNSRTMMVVTACPHNESYDETTFALKFATRVRRIKLGSAHKNVASKNLEETVKNLTSKISSLSKAKERSESQLLLLKREKERVDEKLSKAAVSRANSKEEMRSLTVLRQTNNDITSRWQKEKIIREEKTAELDSVLEELQRVQRDLKNMKRTQESLAQQNEDKENTVFQLKKDLRSMKEQLNEEKIRLRRSQVMQSRIPAPTQATRNANASTQKPLPAQKRSGLMKPSLTSTVSRLSPPTRVNAPERKSDTSAADTSDRKKNDPTNVARIKYRVLKMLQVHDPAKADRIDIVMSKFEGRETELLEKMITKYESGKEEPKSVPTKVEATESTDTSSNGSRPQSRQNKAVERHMARMKRIKAQAVKD